MPNFTVDQAHELVRDAIEKGTRHPGYDRTVELREDYLTIHSGKGWERFVPRFPLRETVEDHLQKLQLTHPNLSSTSSLLEKKFGQISRIQDIKKGLNFEGTSKRDQEDLRTVLNDFGGEGSSQQGSLDDYLTLTYDRIALYDPNAFILFDFGPFNALAGERARPYAVLFECPNVYNFRYTRGNLDYLLVSTVVTYKDSEKRWQTVTDLICYIGSLTIRYFFDGKNGRKDLPEVYESYISPAGKLYRMVVYTPGVVNVPAVRLGYIPDPETKNTTCVSPAFHPALHLFKELIDMKSLNDVVTKKHGFPQQFKQSPPCPGELDPETKFRHICDEGTNKDTGEKCRECGGLGYLVHKSEQDTLIMKLEDNKEDWADLSKLVYTVKPELETIKAFDDKIEKKKLEIVMTVFSSDQQVQVQGPAKTATEYTVSREDQNNTLLPWADQKSSVYKFSVLHIAALMKISGVVKPLYEFSRDLKLTSIEDLYADLKAARDSGAPDFEIEQILDDIARKRYESDPTALEHYFIKKQHIPYFALSMDRFQYFDSTGYIPKEYAVRFASADIIFGEIEIEHPDFYSLPYVDREKLVTEKTSEILAKLPQTVNMSTNLRTLNSKEQQQQQQA